MCLIEIMYINIKHGPGQLNYIYHFTIMYNVQDDFMH